MLGKTAWDINTEYCHAIESGHKLIIADFRIQSAKKQTEHWKKTIRCYKPTDEILGKYNQTLRTALANIEWASHPKPFDTFTHAITQTAQDNLEEIPKEQKKDFIKKKLDI